MIKEIITPLSPASLSSLGSPTMEQKQSTDPATAMPTAAAYFDSVKQDVPRRACHGSHSQNVTSELTEASPTKKDMMNYIEQELAAAAARSGGENAFSAYMAGLNQLSLPPQQHEQPQFMHPQPFPQPQRQYPKPAPLTRAKQNKEDAKTLLSLIHTVELELDDENEIYDSCPEVAQKIEKFLLIDGVNRKIFLEYGVFQKDNYVMLKSFLEGTNQSQCANKIYRRAYVFFEKLRLLEGREKTEERLRNEALYEFGFSTNKPAAQTRDDEDDSDEMDSETEGGIHLLA